MSRKEVHLRFFFPIAGIQDTLKVSESYNLALLIEIYTYKIVIMLCFHLYYGNHIDNQFEMQKSALK